MSETRFTPGPWVALFEYEWSLDTGGENSFQCVGVSEDQIIAAVGVEAAFGLDHILDANVALIAAAPELYEALVYLVDQVERTPGPEIGGVLEALDAIAKARGEA